MAKQETIAKKRKADAKVDVAQLLKENEALKKELVVLQAKKTKKVRTYSLWRSITAGILAVVAVVTFGLFNISYWVKDTVVNTNQFVATMQPLIKDPEIQKTLQTEITNQVFAQINLEQELKNVLPENLGFIAGPFAAQVKSFTYGKIGDVLNSEQAYNVWTQTLTVSHAQILAYIEDPNNSGVITVNSIYELAGEKLKDGDVGFLFGKTLPSKVGDIKLAELKGVPKARQALDVLKQMTFALGAIALVSAALAIAISAKRRNMIIGLAVFTLLFMISTLAALAIAGTQIGAATQVQFSTAAESTYKIITAPLVTQTQGVAAFIGAAILVAIVSSSWKSVAWLRIKMRKGLDWVIKYAVGSWGGSTLLMWISVNSTVICWTLVAVSFVAFAFRIPPTVSGVEQALIASAIAAFGLEVIASITRITSRNSVK